MKTPASLLILLFSVSSAFAAEDYNTKLNQKSEDAKKVLSDRIVVPKQVINPTTMPENLLMIKNPNTSNQEWVWTSLNTNRVTFEPEMQNEIVYQSILDKGFAADLGFLSFVSANVAANDKLEVVAEEVYRASGAPYISKRKEAEALARDYAAAFPAAEFYYVEFVQFTTLKYKVYKDSGVKVKAGYSGVSFGGSAHSSEQGFSLSKIVSINRFPVIVKNGTVTAQPATNVVAKPVLPSDVRAMKAFDVSAFKNANTPQAIRSIVDK